MPPKDASTFELKNGSVDALHLIVKTAEIEVLREELTRATARCPTSSPTTRWWSTCAAAARRQVPLPELATLLQSLRLRPIGVVALDPSRNGSAPAV